MRKMLITLLAAGMLSVLMIVPAGAQGRPDTAPNTECMQNGIAAVKGLELEGVKNVFAFVAKNGLPQELALGLGVEINNGEVASMVPDPIPLAVVLADHRAGDADRAFNYPWCGQTG